MINGGINGYKYSLKDMRNPWNALAVAGGNITVGALGFMTVLVWDYLSQIN